VLAAIRPFRMSEWRIAFVIPSIEVSVAEKRNVSAKMLAASRAMLRSLIRVCQGDLARNERRR
jgi:hypothetical protein